MTEACMTKSERTELPRDPMSIDIFDIPSHPAADAFPMLPDDELDELTADIRANGLLMPLIVGRVDGQMVLVDGRNRREACRCVGVIPDYVLLDGQDPIGYTLSANINRRHMSKGQRAMVMAKMRLFSGQTLRQLSGQNDLSRGLLGNAAVVLKHASDLADSVIAGSLSLDNAYEEARVRKVRAETYESRFNALKAAAPDLAEMVVEEKLSLEEAEAAERERAERTRRNKKLLAEALHSLAAYAYLLNQNRHDEVVHFITCEAELYKHYNFGPVDEFIQALEIFAQHAHVLLDAIRGVKNVEVS